MEETYRIKWDGIRYNIYIDCVYVDWRGTLLAAEEYVKEHAHSRKRYSYAYDSDGNRIPD